MSFDVPQHRHAPIELYGTQATLLVPDPNRFGGAIELGRNKSWSERPVEHSYADGNFRSIGVADLAHAIRSGRPHRASGDLRYHVLEVMEAFQNLLRPPHARHDRQSPATAGDGAARSRTRRARLGMQLGLREEDNKHARSTDRLGRVERP